MTSKSFHHDKALQIFYAAIAAVKSAPLLQQHLQANEKNIRIGEKIIQRKHVNQLIVIAAGKAAAAMAQQAEYQLGDTITKGICVTKPGHALSLSKIKLIEAGHPIPDKNSLQAGEEILQLLKGLTEKDVVLVLLSGGASALMEALPQGCLLHEVQQTVTELINSGANIHEMNTVRKHISRIKGGALAKAAMPAQVYTLILSDVVGDNVDVIASGPTVPDTSFFYTAVSILEKYGLWNATPETIKNHLLEGSRNERNASGDSGNQNLKNCFTNIIGSNKIALQAAVQHALDLGYHTSIIKENADDNTEALARSTIKNCAVYNGERPACFLIGGETSLAVKGTGKGGRNQHFVLCALDELYQNGSYQSHAGIIVLSAGTDGTDGPTDATGAITYWETEMNNSEMEQQIKTAIQNFDSYQFFQKNGGLIKTGPTQTNVMDIMMFILV